MAYTTEPKNVLPLCSDKLTLKFDGRTLLFSAPAFAKAYPAVSGKLHCDFSLAAQKDKNKGPLPAGAYWIDPAQLWTSGPVRDWLSQHTLVGRDLYEGWGEHRITIHALATTPTYGRGGFFIHGGTHSGSAGCVHVTGQGMEDFVGDLERALKGLPSCTIPLTVQYP